MKALVAQELCGPSGLVYTDVDDPVAGDALLVDVRAAGVCYPDLLLISGRYQLRVPPPFIPGTEVAGTVRAAPAGSGFAPGDRVYGATLLGGYAEQALIPPAAAVRTPAELDDAQAVSLPVNYHTAYFALTRRAALQAGETVLVLGSAGGLGDLTQPSHTDNPWFYELDDSDYTPLYFAPSAGSSRSVVR